VKLYASDLQISLGGRTIVCEVQEEEMHVTKLLEDKYLQQVNLCYRPDAKMTGINNIEIFGSVCRETNPPAINTSHVVSATDDRQFDIYAVRCPIFI
jgi:hypothetical protein